MSIARPQALIRRAVAVPVGIVDGIVGRIDAGLDSAMARVDSRIDSRVGSVSSASRSFVIAASRGADRTDCVIERRVEAFDSRVQARIEDARRHGRHSAKYIAAVADGIDFKLAANVARTDRVTQLGRNGLAASGQAIVRATESLETNFETKFATADAIVQSGIARTQARAAATSNLAQAAIARFDARIETDHARVDRVTDLGITAASNAATATFVLVNLAADVTDGAMTSGVARVDARIENRINQGAQVAQAASAYVATKAATSERAMDSTLAYLDDRIDSVSEMAHASYANVVAGIQASDHGLTTAATRVDTRIDRRISQGSYAYVATTNFVMNSASLVDRNLDQRVAKIDTRIDSGFAGLVRAAQSVTYFATDRMDDLDGALTNRVATIDRRVEAFVIETNGGAPNHAGRRASSAPPWVATTLTLVLGTLGAATGAAALNADLGPVEVDRTVSIEASAAHQAVQQYLGIRDSFTAAAASRTRKISGLQADIAAAQKQATRTSLPGSDIVDVANNYGGVPYVRGGTTPRGFDCSGYTQYVFRQLGIHTPRTAAAQSAWATDVAKGDRKVGDLMFWHGGGGVYHVGIYAGNGMMWDSPYPGRRVGKKSIWGSPTYGRPPSSALNGAAIAEIAAKTAELENLQNSGPKLSIKIDPKNTLQTPKYEAPAQAR